MIFGKSQGIVSGKRPLILLVSFLLASLLVIHASGRAADKPSAKSIGDGVTCQCGGCNFTVNNCNHEQCSSRDEMKALAQKEIDAGKSETTILQDFVLRYGTKVLSTPPAGAFNSTVWILPGLAVILGLGAAIVLVRRWRRPRGAPPAPRAPDTSNIDPLVLSAIEEEMEKSGIKE
jgi:cytochrome c-type biogenesis protein CcmH/NrfF